MLTLGTPGVLVDMFFAYPDNNFLHGEVHALLKHSLLNAAFRTQYARHLIVECELLTRLMDVFEENENKKSAGSARSGYMGHVVLMLKKLAKALEPAEGELAQQLALEPALLQRFSCFVECALQPLLDQHATPLGGYYPSSNTYEVDDMTSIEMATLDGLPDINTDDINDLQMCGAGGPSDGPDFVSDCLGLDQDEKMRAAQNSFLEVANQRFDDDMWDDAPEAEAPSVHTVLEGASPWDSPFLEGESGGGGSGEGWAQFMAEAFSQPAPDPFAPAAPSPASAPAPASPTSPQAADSGAEGAATAAFGPEEEFGGARDTHFTPYWGPDTDGDVSGLEEEMQRLGLQPEDPRSLNLANNLLTAMSAMSPDAIADIVSAALDPPYPPPPAPPAPPATPGDADPADR